MYERPRVNVNVERGSTFTFTRDFLYIVSVLFTRIKIYVRTHVKITRQQKSTLEKNSRCLKLYRAYSISFHSSNAGNSLWS